MEPVSAIIISWSSFTALVTFIDFVGQVKNAPKEAIMFSAKIGGLAAAIDTMRSQRGILRGTAKRLGRSNPNHEMLMVQRTRLMNLLRDAHDLARRMNDKVQTLLERNTSKDDKTWEKLRWVTARPALELLEAELKDSHYMIQSNYEAVNSSIAAVASSAAAPALVSYLDPGDDLTVAGSAVRIDRGQARAILGQYDESGRFSVSHPSSPSSPAFPVDGGLAGALAQLRIRIEDTDGNHGSGGPHNGAHEPKFDKIDVGTDVFVRTMAPFFNLAATISGQGK